MAKGKCVTKMKTRNRILKWFSLFIAAFIIYTVVFYSIKGWQWDSLFPYVLGVGGITSVITGAIGFAEKIANIKQKKEDKSDDIHNEQQGV